MSAWRAMSRRGSQSVTAQPLVFATLVLPRSSPACLACPEGDDLPATERVPCFAASAERVLAALAGIAAREPRTEALAAWPELAQAQWVVRSRLMGFADLVVAEAVALPGGGASLRLYSRSRTGWSDFGANRARVRRWLAKLAAELPRAAPDSALPTGVTDDAATAATAPEGATPAPEAPPMEAALARLARGKRVVFAWDNGPQVAALTLRAWIAGAASAAVAHPNRPPHADALLREESDRLGCQDLAAAVLRRAPCAADLLPIPVHADTSRPRPWWIRAALDVPDAAARLGPVDVVIDGSGLMQWWPDPTRRLRELAASGASRLLLQTAALPVSPELAATGFGRDSVWYASRITEAQSAALHTTLQRLHVTLPQFDVFPGPMQPEAAHAAGLEGPWIWFMAAGGVERLLGDAGWTVERVWADPLFPVFEATRP